MEKFKIVERETKTKAYSKEGKPVQQNIVDTIIQWKVLKIRANVCNDRTAHSRTQYINTLINVYNMYTTCICLLLTLRFMCNKKKVNR